MSLSTHANRGRVAEELVRLACESYRRRGLAVVEKVPTEWLPLRGHDGRVVSAKVTRQAPVDEVGCVRGFGPVAFDVKQFASRRWPLSRLEPHQAAFLADWERAGGRAFVLIYHSPTGRGWLLPFGEWRRRHLEGHHREPGASLSPLDLDRCAAPIPEGEGCPLDWLVALGREPRGGELIDQLPDPDGEDEE